MNTFSNFSTFNGCVLPGSGAWVTRGADGNFFVDDNGDLWVPCLCGEDPAAAPEETQAPEPSEAPEPPDVLAPEAPEAFAALEPDGCAILVNDPACILYYPGRILADNGGRYAMGMLADSGKGGRGAYRGSHSGRVLLCVAQANMTSRVAFRDPEDPGRILLTDDDIYPGVDFYYAVVFENHLDTTAAVTVRGQVPFNVAPGAREWLYLGPCGFLRDTGRRIRIGPGRQFEAVLDLELSGRLTIRCCAYCEKGEIDFSGHAWPLQPLADTARPLDSILFGPPVSP